MMPGGLWFYLCSPMSMEKAYSPIDVEAKWEKAHREGGAFRPQGDGIRLAFEGVTDRTSAEALRGDEMWAEVPADESPAGDGEYWDRQLVGLRVLNHAGAEVGRVASVGHLPAQDHLVIATPEGERRVPFVEALVPVVDLEAGFVRLADVPGLIDEAEQA